MDTPRTNLYGLDRGGIAGFLGRYSVPTFHAEQIYRWLYERGCWDPSKWTDLPRGLRERIGRDASVTPGCVDDRTTAGDGTVKYRTTLVDGAAIESVYMTHQDKVTLCVSSQVGCALGCDFCLTGRMGLTRHLTAGEILGQVALIREDRQLGDNPFRIVFMGMGEPLHNYDAVLSAFRTLVDEKGFGMSRRRITISTVGLVPAIDRLAAEPIRPQLAVSLNATTDEVRSRLMPVNRKYSLERLIVACAEFAADKRERMTFEYVLLAGINDTDADVSRLVDLLRRVPAKLNLIPFNPVPGWLSYEPPKEGRILAIRDRLLGHRLPVSVRWSRGAEARAACGQLAFLPEEAK